MMIPVQNVKVTVTNDQGDEEQLTIEDLNDAFAVMDGRDSPASRWRTIVKRYTKSGPDLRWAYALQRDEFTLWDSKMMLLYARDKPMLQAMLMDDPDTAIKMLAEKLLGCNR